MCVLREMGLSKGVSMAPHGIYVIFITTRALEEQLRSAAAAQATRNILLSNLPVTDTNQIKGD